MNRNSARPRLAKAALLALVVAAAMFAAGQACAQSAPLTAAPISPEGGSGAPGQTLPAGVFALVNNLPYSQTIGSVTVAFSNPSLFSSATLTGPKGACASSNPVVACNENGPPPASSKHPSASTTFSFNPPIVIGPGGRPFFALTVTLASAQSRDEHGGIAYARMIPLAHGASGPIWLAFAILGLATATLPAGTRRRAWLLMALMILLAAGTSACGGDSSSSPSSTQTVTAVATIETPTAGLDVREVSTPAPPAGLPLKLGTVTLQ